MPRARLSNVSLKQLLGELNRRKAKLADLIAQRDDLDAQIAELEALTGTPAKPTKKTRRRGRKPGPKPGKKAKGKKRGVFHMTAEQFIVDFLTLGGAMNTRVINNAWKKAGRKGDANVTLSKMTKLKKIKRTGRGVYAIAKKPVRKPKAAAPVEEKKA